MQHILSVKQSALIQVTLHVCYLQLNTKDVPSTVTENMPHLLCTFFLLFLLHNQTVLNKPILQHTVKQHKLYLLHCGAVRNAAGEQDVLGLFRMMHLPLENYF